MLWGKELETEVDNADMRILKYPLSITDTQTLVLPSEVNILKVAVQNGKVFLWALVDTENEDEVELTIKCFGTGQSISMPPKNMMYLDTVFVDEFVWHFCAVKIFI